MKASIDGKRKHAGGERHFPGLPLKRLPSLLIGAVSLGYLAAEKDLYL
jgi:hypothetical protein